MEIVNINVKERNDLGKKATKALRKEGSIPAVLYGGDELVHFATNKKAVKSIIYTPEFKLAEISLGDNSYKAILKDIQFNPVTDEILHLDFLKLTDGRKVKVEVPVRFEGVSPGVLNGGAFIQSIRRIKIITTPENLVDELTIDISGLELGESVKVRDIIPVENVEISTDPAIPVASVMVPRALKSAEAEEESEATTTEEAPTTEGE